VPTVSDRIAQVVAKQLIERGWRLFSLPNSYGYRTGKPVRDAVGVTRERCWKYDWVLEFAMKGLFDNIDPVLLLKVELLIENAQQHGDNLKQCIQAALDDRLRRVSSDWWPEKAHQKAMKPSYRFGKRPSVVLQRSRAGSNWR
jgi:hypothetical protein